MWKSSYQPELYHHGVKGQKWGVRKNRELSLKRAERSIDRAKKISSKRMDRFMRLGGSFAKKRFGGSTKTNDIKAGRNWLHDENIRQNQLFMQTVNQQNYMNQLHQQQVTQMHVNQHYMMFNSF